ncbi:TonB-dependent receptor [Pinibacter aurantiacus]|uniref:TonB-dependent receptor n=1 Tax=Pinibacter aurantiacus TaxID=2851599 RepID=A0A9E2SAA2_9BACT|nr:hypothetical protein [Pinibacter aurantiacus]MBV4358482.1 hypothetical protein [Pinibacter aurantiacus]
MKFLNLMLCGVLACAVANAQTDSTYLDLGRMRARKEFTQTTVIKASDLAQMPFTNLSDAIRLWVNGSYTDKSTMVYVVDGVMINDADAYSIYDIEEITIVQDGLSQPNGAGNLQTLALITTKKSRSAKPHFSFAGQAYVVDRKMDTEKNYFNFFNQYNLTGSGNIGKVAVGGSINFLHDEMPVPKVDGETVATAPDLNRIRLHLWTQTDLGKKSKLSLHVNYTPQFGGGKYTEGATSNENAHSTDFNETLINATLQLQTAFTSALYNKFSVGYTTNKQKGADDVMYNYFVNGDSTSFSRLGKFNANLKGHTFFINDNIGYNWRLKNWSVEPAVNVNFQSIKFDTYSGYFIDAGGLAGPSAGGSSRNGKGNFFTVTPSLAITYKNILNVQGGFVQDFSKLVEKDYEQSNAYPFVTVAANVLPANTQLIWKVYGSYAKTFALNNFSMFQLDDLVSYNDLFSSPATGFLSGPGTYIPQPAKNYNERYQAGSDFSFFKKRITLGYNYLNASDVQYVQLTFPGTGIMYFPGKYTTERHQVSVVGEVLQNSPVKWRTGVFVNFFKNNLNFDGLDLAFDEKPYSGGWTNRFSYKRLSFGADLLYLLNKDVALSPNKTEKHNSILLQNIYLAYALHSKALPNMSVYISSRNLADSNIMPLASDNRRFYGGGVKFDF